jgi:hypothetical protein
MSVLPFINTMVKMPLIGSDLLEALEWSVFDFNESERKGKFLQYSGKQKFRYDIQCTSSIDWVPAACLKMKYEKC